MSPTETSTRSGPRTKMPRAERERLILDSADAVFGERGYSGASMEEIAERAGITKPIVYAYFGSKEELYLAAVSRSGRALMERLLAAVAAPAAKEQLHAAAVAFFAFVIERREGWTVLGRERSAVPAVAESVGLVRSQIVSALAARIRETMDASGGLSAGIDAGALAHAVVGAGEALAGYTLERPGHTAEQLADQLFAAVWHGLAHLESAR